MLDRTTPPPVYMMGDLTLPQPKTEKLINGITVHSFSGGTQDVCQISLVWRGGTSEISNPSVARIMASLLREGTTTMTGAQISEIIDFNGAMLKVISDGHYTYLNLSVLNSKIDAVLPVIYDIICHATMPESAFVTYREIEIKEYMLAHSKVMVLCQEAMSPLVKGKNHPEAYAKSPEEIAAITVDEVRDYYKRVFTADGCTAFVGGLLDHGVYESICKMLASLPSPHKAMDLNIVAYEPEAPETVELQMPEARQAAVCLTLPAPARSHPDYVPLRFTVIALGGYFGSRLMKNIREDKGYTYGIGSYLLGSREGSYIAISAQTDAKYVDLLIEEVRVELRKLVTDPLSDDELVRLRQYISSSLMENLDSPFSIIDYYRTIKCIDLPKGYFESQVDWVHRITADTVIEMAKRYIHPEMLRIAVVK